MDKIPKKMFFYWEGEKLSWMRYMSLYSFCKLNPTWDVTLYVSTDNINKDNWRGTEKQDFLTYDSNDDYLKKIKELNIKIEPVVFPESHNVFMNMNPVYRSDVFRYYKLYKEGGFYADMDILFIKPMDDYYDSIVDNYDTVIYEKDYVAIGVLAASKNNAFYERLFKNAINTSSSKKGYQIYGVEYINKTYGSAMVNPTVIEKSKLAHPELSIISLDKEHFYHFDWLVINQMYIRGKSLKDFSPKSIGYHWYGGHNMSQKYNNLLTEENFKDHKVTFTNLTKEIFTEL